MTMDIQEIARRHGEQAAALYEKVRSRLGADWFLGKGGLEIELTPRGRTLLRCDGLSYFMRHDDTEPIACRVKGGRAEFAEITPDGEWLWMMAPLPATAAMN